MKNKPKELDVDFIGGGGPLTNEEQHLISAFIRASKAKRKLQPSHKKKAPKNRQPQLA